MSAKQKEAEKKTAGVSVKLFNKYDSSNVEVRDPSLVAYINLKPLIVPRTQGKYSNKRFGKSKMHIVERLINKLGVAGHRGKKHKHTSGRNTGKMQKAVNIVKRAFEIIEQKTGENPVQVLVRAVENSAPLQEITVIEHGGIRHPKCVDVAPQRRVDLALRWITQGSFQASVKSKTSIEQALARELINASKKSDNSFSINKRVELERQAAASR